MSITELTAKKLSEIVAEEFKGIFANISFEVQYQPTDVLRFYGSVDNQRIGHSFILAEWITYFNQGIQHHELEKVKRMINAILAQG